MYFASILDMQRIDVLKIKRTGTVVQRVCAVYMLLCIHFLESISAHSHGMPISGTKTYG